MITVLCICLLHTFKVAVDVVEPMYYEMYEKGLPPIRCHYGWRVGGLLFAHIAVDLVKTCRSVRKSLGAKMCHFAQWRHKTRVKVMSSKDVTETQLESYLSDEREKHIDIDIYR